MFIRRGVPLLAESVNVCFRPIGQTLYHDSQPIGEPGKLLERNFIRFAEDLEWWAEAAKAQRARSDPPF